MKSACIFLLSIGLVSCDKSSKEPTADKKSAVQIAREKRAELRAGADKKEAAAPAPADDPDTETARALLAAAKNFVAALREEHEMLDVVKLGKTIDEKAAAQKRYEQTKPRLEATRDEAMKVLKMPAPKNPSTAHVLYRANTLDFLRSGTNLADQLVRPSRSKNLSPAEIEEAQRKIPELEEAYRKWMATTPEDLSSGNYWHPSQP